VSRVLLTGATGLIGSRAIAPLLEAGHVVHALIRGARPAGHPGGASVSWHSVDLFDQETTRSAIAEIRAEKLLHFAWYAEHGSFWSGPENLAWVGATLNLVRDFHEAGGARAVLAGSCAEYEWRADTVCSEADTPLLPATLYGVSKRATHMVASAYAESVGLGLAWGRIFLCYGPGEDERRLVPSVIRALLSGREAEVGDGARRRDLMHVDDVARAFVALLDSSVLGAVNIASGEEISVAEVVGLIAQEVGRPELVRLGALPPGEGDPQRLVADVVRLLDKVGFERRVTLERGIRDTVAWWRAR
jgi:nucleoside-diphosphate-sugar epimerase